MSRAGEGGVAVGGAVAAGEDGVTVMTIIPRADLSEAPARTLTSRDSGSPPLHLE